MHQSPIPLIGLVRQPNPADPDIVAQLPTFRSALRHSINHSGLTQEVIAQALRIDIASLSRMIRDPSHLGARPREFPHDKLEHFCRITNSLAPIQWHDAQLGFEPAQIRETRLQRLERELAEERARAVGIDIEQRRYA